MTIYHYFIISHSHEQVVLLFLILLSTEVSQSLAKLKLLIALFLFEFLGRQTTGYLLYFDCSIYFISVSWVLFNSLSELFFLGQEIVFDFAHIADWIGHHLVQPLLLQIFFLKIFLSIQFFQYFLSFKFVLLSVVRKLH